MIDRPKARLTGIEAVRGVAATTVVLYHVSRYLNRIYDLHDLKQVLQFGHAGVDLFFVISGFIILFVHERDIGQASRLGNYAARRFSRVMLIYWVALGVTMLLAVAAGHAPPSLARAIWSITLLPMIDEPVLGVAWTLQYEVVFYAVFAVLIANRRLGLAILAAWLLWVSMSWTGLFGNSSVIPGSLYSAYNIEFFLGMGAACWLRHGTVPMPQVVLLAGLVLFAAVSAAESTGMLDGYASPARLAYGVPAALLTVGLAETERSGRLSVPAWLCTLGGASYSIYLFQFVFIGVVWQLWLACGLGHRTSGWASFPVLVCAAVAGGIAVSRTVERPLMRMTESIRICGVVTLRRLKD